MEVKQSSLVLNVASLLLMAPMIIISSLAAPAGTPIPTCVELKCASSGSCLKVPILPQSPHDGSAEAGLESRKVLCMNNDLPAEPLPQSYQLTGCPKAYFNTLQNISGVCMITTDDNTTDLLVTANELPSGLHSFDCWYSKSPTGMISSSFIVVDIQTPYRDFLLYVNGALLNDHSSTNVTLQVGDNFTVVVRAVGNVMEITYKNNSHFICATGFACNQRYNNGINNRYLKCSLRSPVLLSDNNRTLTISVDNVELEKFTITVNNNSTIETINTTDYTVTPPPSEEASEEEGYDNSDNNSSDTTLIIILIIIGSAVLICLIVFLVIYYKKRSSNASHNEEGKDEPKSEMTADTDLIERGIPIASTAQGVPEAPTAPGIPIAAIAPEVPGLAISTIPAVPGTPAAGASREMEVFLKYYSRLINILSSTVNNIKHELVSLRIIDQGDIEEINGTLRSKDKVAVILKKIQNHLEEGNAESFYALLNEMEKFHTNDDLVNEIRGEIKTVLSSSCPHCHQFYDDIIRHGYTVKKLPVEGDANGDILKTLLDQCTPLLTCSCVECKLPTIVVQLLQSQLLQSPMMPRNWNILQLHHGGVENILQYNGVTHIDLDNTRIVNKILDWLNAKSFKRNSTSSENRRLDLIYGE